MSHPVAGTLILIASGVQVSHSATLPLEGHGVIRAFMRSTSLCVLSSASHVSMSALGHRIDVRRCVCEGSLSTASEAYHSMVIVVVVLPVPHASARVSP
jgi:hypothetical protein